MKRPKKSPMNIPFNETLYNDIPCFLTLSSSCSLDLQIKIACRVDREIRRNHGWDT